LVNVETKGYKSETLVTRSFRDMLISRLNDPSVYKYDSVGAHNTGIHIDQKYTSFTQGSLEHTNVSTDFALTEDGFFCIDYTIEDDEGEEYIETRYTRNGAFNVDSEGMLVTGTGHYVLDEDYDYIEVGSTDFTVGADGFVYDADGEEITRLLIVRFVGEDDEGEPVSLNHNLRKVGDNMYTYWDADPEDPYEPEQVYIEVKQGYLENANVDTAREMVMMMQVYRAYEINQRVVRMLDESLGRAVNDIARV